MPLRLGALLLLPPFLLPAFPEARVSFSVHPSQPLMDDRISIQVSGLPPNSTILIRARSRARDLRWWRSQATFDSGAAGVVDLGTEPPVSGSYRGADAMGLYWSMQPDEKPKEGDRAFFRPARPSTFVVTAIEVLRENNVIGSVAIERRLARPGIRCVGVADDGAVGVLCDPGDGLRHPGVIVLGGSEGGFDRGDAEKLASRGYTALSLGYFGADGLPPTLQNIPIEYFGKALRWMCARPEVRPGGIAMIGTSRGAEAALLAAAAFPEVAAVVGISPAHARWEGLNANRMPAGPAWTWEGRPLPYIPNRIGLRFAARFLWDRAARIPVPTTPLFFENLADYGGRTDAEIPVEKIRAPVLVLSGKEDQVWPSSLMAERVMARLRRHRHPYRDEHMPYDAAGHWLPNTYVPLRGSRRAMKWAIGGAPEGTAKAQAQAWPKVLRFLGEAFDN